MINDSQSLSHTKWSFDVRIIVTVFGFHVKCLETANS